MNVELTTEQAQFLFRACNFLLADMAVKSGNPLPEAIRPRARMINDIKEKIKAEAAKDGIDITEDI